MTDAKVAEAKSFLPYKSVDIYFIFSFVLEHLGSAEEICVRLDQLDWSKGPPEDRKGRPPFLDIKMEVGGQLRAKTRSQKLPIDESRTALIYEEWDHECQAQKLSREQAREHKPHPLAHPEEPRTDSFDVGVEAWARLFDNGAGCITFRIRLEGKNVSFRRVYEALSLSQRLYERKESHASIKLNGRDGNLFAHFRTFLAELVEKINGGEADQEGESPPLVSLQDEEIMEVSLEAVDNDEIDAQNPYVLTVVELDAESPHAYFLRDRVIDTLQFKELTAILLRLVYPFDFFRELQRNLEFVRIPQELLIDGLYLRNYAWDSRSLMCFSKTSSLFACVNKYEIPAALIRYSLLDTLEIVRTRWHMSILINAQLDHELSRFKSESSEENLALLQDLITCRRRFAAFLHDPLPYSFEGGSASQIAEVAALQMQLPQLRQMTFEKFQTLDQLHADVTKLIGLRNFRAYASAIRIGGEESDGILQENK